MITETLNRPRVAARFVVPTQYGALTAEIGELGIQRISLPQTDDELPLTGYQRVTPAVQAIAYKAIRQLSEYFEGRRRIFRLPVDVSGTDFQQRVWEAISLIPFGETRTYGELADAIGAPDAARAVGMACGANPLPVVVPCHRVVGGRGELGGFSAGTGWKSRMLEIEGVRLF